MPATMNGMDKGRVYQKGRSTEGWRKGKKVTSLDQLQAGTVVISVSHPFQAENLLQIVPSDPFPVKRDIAYYVYVTPELEKMGDSMALWGWELEFKSSEYFIAVRD